jgi:hypothetical protein
MPLALACLLEACWQQEPAHRPCFGQVLAVLLQLGSTRQVGTYPSQRRLMLHHACITCAGQASRTNR